MSMFQSLGASTGINGTEIRSAAKTIKPAIHMMSSPLSIDFSFVALITREENRSQIGLGRSWSRLARVCGTLAALGPLLGHS